MPTLEELQTKYGKKAQEEKKDSKIEDSYIEERGTEVFKEEFGVLEEIKAPTLKVQKTVKKVLPIENIEKQKKEPTIIKKDMFLKDLEYVLDKSGYKVIIELNDKTPTRLKSGILQANKIKGYCNMKDKELDNEISRLIANNILKTLKGAE